MREMTLRELQLFALEILKDVDQFCSENDIQYSLYGGTLLGAVRHQGFIPWDDDIDIIMPRNDYEKFCKLYHSPHFILVNRSKDSSFQLAYTRVCDVKRTWYEAVEPCSRTNTGVWIDVFPADGCPSDEDDIPPFYEQNRTLFWKTEEVRWTLVSYSSLWRRRYASKGLYRAMKSMLGLLLRKSYYSITGRRNYWINNLIELNSKYKYEESRFWASFSCPYKHVVYHPKNDFSYCEKMKFEDSKFCAMNGYNNYLRRVYGNYMELPPKDQQVPPLSVWYKFYWK